MTLAAQTASDVVQCKHHLNHPIEKVFAAWSQPEALGQWFGPHSHKCKVEKYDFSEGGSYQIRMIPLQQDTDCAGEAGEDSVCAGQFIKINSPHVIIMSFNWIEGGADMGDTLLTVEFNDNNGRTDIVLTHEKIPSEELRQAHQDGWTGSLECLDEYLG